VVYCSTINRLEETASQLQRALGDKILVIYHGQMDAARKEASMRQFMDGHADVCVATNAFGMGVDKADVRAVIHRDIPANIEALAQELGRGGRDGKLALGITLFSPDSLRTQRQFLDNGHPSRSEVEKFFYAIKSMADKNTMTVSASAEVLEKMSGVHKFAQRAVRSILLGANVLATVPITQKICTIKYTGSSEDAQFRKYKEAVLGVGQVLKDGAIECDVENLADQLLLTDATVIKNLKLMAEKGLLDYTPPPRLTPLKVIGDISAVDFARLAMRRKQCELKLQQVIDYQHVPDNERHAYIEKCFGH
jgi:ATP-dependent DNA helicase RecQ